MDSERPKVGVGVFVWRDGKFWIGQRNGAHGAGSWSIPGGHLEYGESWEQCAAREVFEETGMTIQNINFLAATNDIFPEESKHYITIWMTSDWEANEPENKEPDKLLQFTWCDFKTLPSPLFLPWEQLRNAKPELFA